MIPDVKDNKMDYSEEMKKDMVSDEVRDTSEVSVWGEIFSFVKILLMFIFFIWFIHAFVVEGYEVWGPSMMNTLDEGDRILVFKLPCVLKNFPLFPEQWKIHEGDIIVFQGKDENGRRYVKRVIAMVPAGSTSKIVNASGQIQNGIPQKKVEYSHNKVYVNNHLVDESYLDTNLNSSEEEDLVFLHPGEYYVLGDNRKISKDSRFFGPVTEDQIVGKAVFRFWPLSKMGWL